ncbi:hypothetical protein [Streptomyces sp. NPDC050546]
MLWAGFGFRSAPGHGPGLVLLIREKPVRENRPYDYDPGSIG